MAEQNPKMQSFSKIFNGLPSMNTRKNQSTQLHKGKLLSSKAMFPRLFFYLVIQLEYQTLLCYHFF